MININNNVSIKNINNNNLKNIKTNTSASNDMHPTLNLNNSRESMPRCNVEARLFVLEKEIITTLLMIIIIDLMINMIKIISNVIKILICGGRTLCAGDRNNYDTFNDNHN